MTTLIKQTAREYKDMSFSMAAHPETNNLLLKTNVNAVKQSVVNLLTLMKGDKPFHPEINSPIYKYLFGNAGIIEKVVLESDISSYLNTYEPRLRLISVVVSFSSPNHIECTIVGELINTYEPITVNVLINRLR